ncbi:hypothetical protein EDB81DRAFT_943520 [Dactylonectria macrodidyma]|uniref:Uncharacterized protein n=1 Tax=Dactylonectria macrodidyma TaxID=307937 RepID=A0A9P9JGI3_9HYPO|nr:hypothetical protein EDB81DRAFT_943520 [Dactylonectria macrodidyma]
MALISLQTSELAQAATIIYPEVISEQPLVHQCTSRSSTQRQRTRPLKSTSARFRPAFKTHNEAAFMAWLHKNTALFINPDKIVSNVAEHNPTSYEDVVLTWAKGVALRGIYDTFHDRYIVYVFVQLMDSVC